MEPFIFPSYSPPVKFSCSFSFVFFGGPAFVFSDSLPHKHPSLNWRIMTSRTPASVISLTTPGEGDAAAQHNSQTCLRMDPRLDPPLLPTSGSASTHQATQCGGA